MCAQMRQHEWHWHERGKREDLLPDEYCVMISKKVKIG